MKDIKKVKCEECKEKVDVGNAIGYKWTLNNGESFDLYCCKSCFDKQVEKILRNG